jgi:hypothetical protein
MLFSELKLRFFFHLYLSLFSAVNQMKATMPAFDRIHEKLRNCMYYKQQINYEIARAKNSTNAAAGHTHSIP